MFPFINIPAPVLCAICLGIGGHILLSESRPPGYAIAGSIWMFAGVLGFYFRHIGDQKVPTPIKGCISALVLAYGIHGVWSNGMVIPLARVKGQAGFIHLHGFPAWMLLGALVTTCFLMFFDHNDRPAGMSKISENYGPIVFLVFLICFLYSMLYMVGKNTL